MKPEDALHVAVAQFFDFALPADVFWTTIPAGGGGQVRGAQLKAKGYKAGTPDLHFTIGGRSYWIELKAGKGRLSDAQKKTIPSIEEAGGVVVVARSVDDVAWFLTRWGVQLRGRIAA